MKKLKAVVMILCVVFCMSACKKSEDKAKETKNNNPTTQTETKKDETKKEKKEENKKKDESNKKEDNKSQKTDNNEKIIKKTGLFLGLDGSNFAVVIVNDENGNATQLNLQLSKDVDINNSDVGIGDNVNIEYTADETDNKILKKISKVK